MSNILANAFSLQMLSSVPAVPIIEKCDISEIAELLSNKNITSAIGHADLASVLTDILGHDVPMNRVSVSIESGDVLYIAQVTGGRLPEGCTKLPEGFTLEFLRVRVLYAPSICTRGDGRVCDCITHCPIECSGLYA